MWLRDNSFLLSGLQATTCTEDIASVRIFVNSSNKHKSKKMIKRVGNPTFGQHGKILQETTSPTVSRKVDF